MRIIHSFAAFLLLNLVSAAAHASPVPSGKTACTVWFEGYYLTIDMISCDGEKAVSQRQSDWLITGANGSVEMSSSVIKRFVDEGYRHTGCGLNTSGNTPVMMCFFTKS